MKILVILFIVFAIITALLIVAYMIAEAYDKEGKWFKDDAADKSSSPEHE